MKKFISLLFLMSYFSFPGSTLAEEPFFYINYNDLCFSDEECEEMEYMKAIENENRKPSEKRLPLSP